MAIRKRVVFKYVLLGKGDSMDIEKNRIYACRVVRINGEEVDCLSTLVVDEECITRITIKEVERKIYDKVRNEAFV